MKVKTDKLAKALKIFDNLYNEYVEDLKGWTLMNTSLSGNDRDKFYKERTFQLCEIYRKEVGMMIEKEFYP
jgi:hypothetical protein